MTFVIDVAGNKALLDDLALGMQAIAEDARDNARTIFRSIQGSRGTSGWEGAPPTGIYAKSLSATTMLGGKVVQGREIEGPKIMATASVFTLVSFVWSPSYKSHLLEFGSGPHLIRWKSGRVIPHPGGGKRPHLWPGFAMTVPRIGSLMARHAGGAGIRRRNVGAYAYGPGITRP